MGRAMADYTWLAYLGIFLGVLGRTVIPYVVKKAMAGQNPFTFDPKYAGTAIGALVSAWLTAQPLFAQFTLSNPVSAFGAFWAGLLFSGIVNSIWNWLLLDYHKPQASATS